MKKNYIVVFLSTQLLSTINASINKPNKDGETILHAGLHYRKIEDVKFLIDNGADVNIEDNNGETLLFKIVHWNTPRRNNCDFIKLLIQAKADVNKKSRNSLTPLAIAIHLGNEAVVKLLLDAGARRNVGKGDNTADKIIKSSCIIS